MERYLYFTDSAADGNADLAMYPTSSVTAVFAASATTTTINFVPRDGTGTTEDVITLTHSDGDHKNVMSDLVAIINAEKNNSPFAVVCDAINGVYNLGSVTSLAITSAD
tara:strand:+ start:551 stop:877 length:327 start_codon:yes stop_codon:yes gene_type:complete